MGAYVKAIVEECGYFYVAMYSANSATYSFHTPEILVQQVRFPIPRIAFTFQKKLKSIYYESRPTNMHSQRRSVSSLPSRIDNLPWVCWHGVDTYHREMQSLGSSN